MIKRKKIGLAIIVLIIAILIFVERGKFEPVLNAPEVHLAASTVTTIATALAPQPQPQTPLKLPPGIPIPPTQPPEAVGHAVGIAGGGSLSKVSTSALNTELDQMVALGVKWVRFDIEWGNVQYSTSSPEESTWNSYDTLVNAIAAHHLYSLGIILFTPQWARDPSCHNGVECPPADPATFAKFAGEVAARYKDDGLHYWEIWNEPNGSQFWAPKTDCNAYTTLLKATYPAIKSADPNAVIITGGLTPAATNGTSMSPADFLSCIYKAGGKQYFDAIGDHPYVYPNSPAADTAGAWAQMFKTMPSLRSIMNANSDGNKKIWLTEFGAPTNGPDPHWYVSESTQATMMTATMQLYKSYPWAGPIFWYTLRDSGTTTDTNENFFGLTRHDGSTKPAYTVLQNIIKVGL